MKSKIWFWIIIIVVAVAAFFLVSARPAGFVGMPDPVRLQITGLVVAVVGFAVSRLIVYVPFLAFLEEFKDPIAMALAAELIALLENALPSAYPEISLLSVQLALAVLAVFKVFQVLGKRGNSTFL